jgi:hypothetical protein
MSCRSPCHGEELNFYSAEEVVLSGSFDQVNTVFDREGWSNGLSINPPTPDRVNKFLRETPDDPERLVPIVKKSEDFVIVVSGDPLRSNAYVCRSNGMDGYPTSKVIRMKPGDKANFFH